LCGRVPIQKRETKCETSTALMGRGGGWWGGGRIAEVKLNVLREKRNERMQPRTVEERKVKKGHRENERKP